MAPNAAPLTLPRGLIFMASIWLIGSWLITIGVRTPIQPVSASYTPAVRMMLICMIVGLMIGWPLLRLSQGRSDHPIGQTVLDLVVLLALTQVVVWPLRLVTPWTVQRTAAIDATISGWVLVAGAIVASALGVTSAGVRALAMLVCLCICLLGPALATFGPLAGLEPSQLAALSPLMGVHQLAVGGGALLSAEQWGWTAVLGGAAVVAWIAAALLAVVRRSHVVA